MPFNPGSISQLQTYLDVSDRKLADLCGISRASLARYKRGEDPKTVVLDKLYSFAAEMGAYHIDFYKRPAFEPPETVFHHMGFIDSRLEREV